MMSTIQYEYESDAEFYQSDEWAELREEILERDDHLCQVCFSGYFLQVHHIVPRKYKYIVSWDIDQPSNLLTLCRDCHKLADRKLEEE